MLSRTLQKRIGITLLVLISFYIALLVWDGIRELLFMKRIYTSKEAASVPSLLWSILFVPLAITLYVGVGKFVERHSQTVPVWYMVITGVIPGIIIFYCWRMVHGQFNPD